MLFYSNVRWAHISDLARVLLAAQPLNTFLSFQLAICRWHSLCLSYGLMSYCFDLAVFLWSWEHFAWVDFVPCLDLADHSNLSKFIYLLWHSQFSNQIIVIFVTLAMWHDTQKALFAVSFNWANSKATRLGLKYILVHSLLQSFLVLQI